jgi:hypothetical protein
MNRDLASSDPNRARGVTLSAFGILAHAWQLQTVNPNAF